MPSDPPSTAPRPRRRLWPWLAALASGAMLALSFPPVELGGLAFLGLTPLLWAVWKYRPARRPGLFRFFAGYVCGVVYFTATFWWIGQLAPLYETPALWCLPFALSLYLALYPALWAWFAGWIVGGHFDVEPIDPLAPFSRPPLLSSLRNLGIAFILGAAWTALEWVRGWLFTGFGWNGLGVALYDELALIQITTFTGVGGLSFLLVVCNVTAIITILRLRAEIGRTRLRPHFDFALTVAIVVMVFAYGVRVLPPRPIHPPGPVLRVAAVQPNISQRLKFGLDADDSDVSPAERIREATAQRHLIATYGRPERISVLWNPLWNKQVSFTVLVKPQLVLWPEASLMGGCLRVEDNVEFVQKLALDTPALLLGTDDMDREGPGDDHNSAALFLHGNIDEAHNVYDKMHLVPYGEYLPMRPLLGGLLGSLCPGDFLPGKETKVFHLPDPGVVLGPSVCFEDTDGDLSRQPVRMGAQILVNITNDGWFRQSCGAEVHLQNSIFRAVENRRPMVRCGNTGETCLVDAYGRIDRWSPLFAAYPTDTSKAVHDVPYEREPALTFYTRHGEVFSIACVAATLLVLIARMLLLRRQANPPAGTVRKNGGQA